MRTAALAWVPAICLAVGLPALGSPPGPAQPPKVLVIVQQTIKPGMETPYRAAAHAGALARERANWAPFLGIEALTGAPQTWYLIALDSVADWAKLRGRVAANPVLEAELDRLARQAGAFVAGESTLLAAYRGDLSYGQAPAPGDFHTLEVITARVRPGHEQEFERLAKMLVDTNGRANAPVSVTAYEAIAGAPAGTYLFLVPSSSLATWENRQKETAVLLAETLGEQGRKRMDELKANSTLTIRNELFVVDPGVSYVSDEWRRADPGFWREGEVVHAPRKPRPGPKR
ncbi:MAG TPA: hypothetical protein VGS20_01205 [Candidatus Acidoferrales bacterium]|nr:hypothetical protein [Candidatus Acidoferrales bacterium]